jgi:hypothetical protein
MMFTARDLSVLVAVIFAAASVGYGQSAGIPKGWKEVDKCGLRFRVPESMTDEKREGIDSCVAVYSNDRLVLSIDYGWYSGVGKFDSYQNYKEQKIVIDGKPGELATYQDSRGRKDRSLVARIYVSIEPPLAVNMFIYYGDPKDLEKARAIFQSIRFLKGQIRVDEP